MWIMKSIVVKYCHWQQCWNTFHWSSVKCVVNIHMHPCATCMCRSTNWTCFRIIRGYSISWIWIHSKLVWDLVKKCIRLVNLKMDSCSVKPVIWSHFFYVPQITGCLLLKCHSICEVSQIPREYASESQKPADMLWSSCQLVDRPRECAVCCDASSIVAYWAQHFVKEAYKLDKFCVHLCWSFLHQYCISATKSYLMLVLVLSIVQNSVDPHCIIVTTEISWRTVYEAFHCSVQSARPVCLSVCHMWWWASCLWWDTEAVFSVSWCTF